MRIEIIKGKDPQLKVPQFVCDKVLKKDVPPPYNYLVDGFKFCLFVGRPQSGKTSHVFSLFRDKRCLKKVWNNIILIMPSESLASMRVESNVFKDLDPEKMFTDIDEIHTVRQMVKSYAAEGETSCILIDDQTAKLKDPIVEKVLSDIVMNRRHYKTSIVMLSQLVERVPLKIRKLVNTVILQYKPSKKELLIAFDEWLELKPEVAQEIGKVAFQKPYDFLLIDIPSQSIYANYNKLIIHEEEQDTTTETD